MKKIKLYKCRHCKKEFQRSRTTQVVCSFECAKEYAKKKEEKKQKKEWNQRKNKIKESLKTKQDYVNELQPIFNEFIRLRDRKKPCISCDKPANPNEKRDAGHFKPAGSKPQLRFDEDNCHSQCVKCNRDEHGNIHGYRPRLILRIGQKRVDRLDAIANDAIQSEFNFGEKLEIPDLKLLISAYKSKIKALKSLQKLE